MRYHQAYRKFTLSLTRGRTEDITEVMISKRAVLRVLMGLAVCGLAWSPAQAACYNGPAPGVDWSGCMKRHKYLADGDLTGANFERTNLSLSNLQGATLIGANLIKSDLTKTILRGANLSRANLTGA